MQYVLWTTVVLGWLSAVLGGPVLDYTPCNADCDSGMTTAQLCTDSIYCGSTTADCNIQPCKARWNEWSPCNATCGGGTRTRTSKNASVDDEVIVCNVFACPPKHNITACPLDVIFALDGSGSIGQRRFDSLKQMAMDMARSLPVGQDRVHIGLIHYTTTATAVFSLTQSYDQSEIADMIWDLEFTGGSTCAANALAGIRDMFTNSGTANRSRAVVVFGDGIDHHAALEAYTITREINQYAHAHVVRIGNDPDMGLFTYGQQPNILSATDIHTPIRIADAILVESGCMSKDEIRNYTMNDIGSVQETAMKASAGHAPVCTVSTTKECLPCLIERTEVCVTTSDEGSDETLTEITNDPCTTPCPTTTTQAPGPYPDCSRCDYTKGQTWFPDPDNCHLFYICEKIDDYNGQWHYIVHHPTCGALYWDQERLTCVTVVPANCTVGNVVTFPTLSTTHAPCPYKTLANPQQFESIASPGNIYECETGFNFIDADEPCTCIPVGPIDPTCDSELLLHIPYTVNFDDVTCHKAKGYSYGEGEVKIVHDADRGQNVAQFDGKSRIEMAFMRNWLQDQNQQAWTVTAWVKRIAGPFDLVGFVDNGDCIDRASFLLHGNVDANDAPTAFGGIAADNGFPATETGGYCSLWTVGHLAVVYDGSIVTLFVDKIPVKTVAVSGAILNTQNPLYVGMHGCDSTLGYFKGRIDDVRIYTVALDAAKIALLP